MHRSPRLARLALAVSLLLAPAAQAADPTAADIIKRSSDNRTVSNSIQTMTLEIFDKSGASRVRTITSKVKRGADDASRSYVFFEAPEDVRGVQFLSIENPTGEDDQWMYMPAVGSANRISGSSRKSSFMGTDFTYEDMSIGQPEDGDHTLRGKQQVTVGGRQFDAYVVESVPKAELKSAYAKIVTFVDTTDYMPRQVDLFDSKGEHVKRMTFPDVVKDGAVLVPKKIVMENLKRGTRTELRVEQYKVNVPAAELPDALFTKEFIEGEG